MTAYFVIKREPCGKCDGDLLKDPPCVSCQSTGIIETRINADEWLLSRLTALRWDGDHDKNTAMRPELTMENPRFED